MKQTTMQQLPLAFQNNEVATALQVLEKRRAQLFFKRLQDLLISGILILLLSPALLVLSIAVAVDSEGPIFFLQERVGKNGKIFRIVKFRTMVVNAEALGAKVTGDADPRITRVGQKLRHLRLDEIPQLFNIFVGQMSFVGTRPEVPQYVAVYDEKMMTTLLLPPGLTSMTSIRFRNEAELLKGVEDPDRVYIETILPQKMAINEEYLEKAGPIYDFKVMVATVMHVFFGRGEA